MHKPFVQACENNKHAIAEALQSYLRNVRTILEIGSGTGQHIVHFASCFPHITWQASDLKENHAGINAWIRDSKLPNVNSPIEFDLEAVGAPVHNTSLRAVDAVYSANVVHIIETRLISRLFLRASEVLTETGLVFMYGPFNYEKRFTSEGNRRLDAWLKSQHPDFGIRDFEYVDEIARTHGLSLMDDLTMPANNRLLVWRTLA